MRISDWSSDVCSSDLAPDASAHKFRRGMLLVRAGPMPGAAALSAGAALRAGAGYVVASGARDVPFAAIIAEEGESYSRRLADPRLGAAVVGPGYPASAALDRDVRSEEHTSELQSLMRISYAVFCLKKKNTKKHKHV